MLYPPPDLHYNPWDYSYLLLLTMYSNISPTLFKYDNLSCHALQLHDFSLQFSTSGDKALLLPACGTLSLLQLPQCKLQLRTEGCDNGKK